MKGLTPNLTGLGLQPGLVKVLEDAFRALREIGGVSVDQASLDRFVQRKDLVAWGFGTTSSAGTGLTPSSSDSAFDSTPPDAPSGLVALGGYAQIMLKWDAPVDSRRGYFEIWRASANNLSLAVKIAQTTAWVYQDPVQNGANQYYWVRSVSRFSDSIVSGWSATSGTAATTAPDVAYALSVMTGAAGDQPFYYQASPTTIGGVAVPAGTYIKSLFVYAGTVALFRAGLAVIDDANILSLNAVKITTGTMSADRIDAVSLVAKMGTFTTGDFGTIFAGKAFLVSANINDHLQSDNFNGNPSTSTPGTLGWYFGRSGKLYASEGHFRGTVEAATFIGGTFSGGSFSGGAFSGATITGGTVTGGTVIAGLIRSNIAMSAYTTPAGSRVGSVTGWTFNQDLTASGTSLVMHVNGRWRLYADGRMEADDVIISRSNVVYSATLTAAPGAFFGRWLPTPPIYDGSGSF